MAAQLNLGGYLGSLRSAFTLDKFRPIHLRYLQYIPQKNNFKLLLDKGDTFVSLRGSAEVGGEAISKEAKTLLRYFLIGLALPNDSFWVNLRPDSSDNIIDPWLAQTDVGRIMLEADLQLKQDTAKATSPETPEGRKYWELLYKKAEEIFGYENVIIPTLTRPWIVPGEIIIRESADSAYIYKATLKVMLEQDYLSGGKAQGINYKQYSFKDPRLKALNEYSSQLIRELIIPKLTKEVNSSRRYAPLRQVYYSLVMAQWFKVRFRNKRWTYSQAIDHRNLVNLTSITPWAKNTYFEAYQRSFKEGEYNIQEPRPTPFGQSIRSYFSGGMELMTSELTGAVAGRPAAGKVVLSSYSERPANPNNIEVVIDNTQEQELSQAVNGVATSSNRRNSAIKTGRVKHLTITEIIAKAIEEGNAYKVWAKRTGPMLEGDVDLPIYRNGEMLHLVEFFMGEVGGRLSPGERALLDGIDMVVIKGGTLLYYANDKKHQALHVGHRRRTIYIGERLWLNILAEEGSVEAMAGLLAHELCHIAHPGWPEVIARIREKMVDPRGILRLRIEKMKTYAAEDAEILRKTEQLTALERQLLLEKEKFIPNLIARLDRELVRQQRIAFIGVIVGSILALPVSFAIRSIDFLCRWFLKPFLDMILQQLSPEAYEKSLNNIRKKRWKGLKDDFGEAIEERIARIRQIEVGQIEILLRFLEEEMDCRVLRVAVERAGDIGVSNSKKVRVLRRSVEALKDNPAAMVRDAVNRVLRKLDRGGQLKPIGIRSSIEDDTKLEELNNRHEEFEAVAKDCPVENISEMKARVFSADLGEINGYHFDSQAHGLVIVLNRVLWDIDARHRIFEEAKFHEAKEAYWESKGFTSHEAHVIAWAEQIRRFSSGGDCLTPYHVWELSGISLEGRLAMQKENENSRQWHHSVLERANKEHSANIDMDRVRGYEARLRAVAVSKGKIGQRAKKIVMAVIDYNITLKKTSILPFGLSPEEMLFERNVDYTIKQEIGFILQEGGLNDAECELLIEACAGVRLSNRAEDGQKGAIVNAIAAIASKLGFKEELDHKVKRIEGEGQKHWHQRNLPKAINKFKEALAWDGTFGQFTVRYGSKDISEQEVWRAIITASLVVFQRAAECGVALTDLQKEEIRQAALDMLSDTALEEGMDSYIEVFEFLENSLKERLGIEITWQDVVSAVDRQAKSREVKPGRLTLPGEVGSRGAETVDPKQIVSKHLHDLTAGRGPSGDLCDMETIELMAMLVSYNYWLQVAAQQGGSFADAFQSAYFFAYMQRGVAKSGAQKGSLQSERVELYELLPQAYTGVMAEATDLNNGDWKSAYLKVISQKRYENWKVIFSRLLSKFRLEGQISESGSVFLSDLSLLGLSRGVSWVEVKKAYRSLARECHPDVNPDKNDTEQRFKKINTAFDRLRQLHQIMPDLFSQKNQAQPGHDDEGPRPGWEITGASHRGKGLKKARLLFKLVRNNKISIRSWADALQQNNEGRRAEDEALILEGLNNLGFKGEEAARVSNKIILCDIEDIVGNDFAKAQKLEGFINDPSSWIGGLIITTRDGLKILFLRDRVNDSNYARDLLHELYELELIERGIDAELAHKYVHQFFAMGLIDKGLNSRSALAYVDENMHINLQGRLFLPLRDVDPGFFPAGREKAMALAGKAEEIFNSAQARHKPVAPEGSMPQERPWRYILLESNVDYEAAWETLRTFIMEKMVMYASVGWPGWTDIVQPAVWDSESWGQDGSKLSHSMGGKILHREGKYDIIVGYYFKESRYLNDIPSPFLVTGLLVVPRGSRGAAEVLNFDAELALPVAKPRIIPLSTSLSSEDRQYLDDFMSNIPGDMEAVKQVKRLFSLFSAGECSAMQLFKKLSKAGVSKDQVRALFIQYIKGKKSQEVKDARPAITFQERMAFLEGQEKYLSFQGKEYLGRLKNAFRSGDLARIQQLSEDFPSPANPHLDYFIPLLATDDEIRNIDPIVDLRITQGCSQHCRHCAFNPTGKVKVVPFNRILSLLEALSNKGDQAFGRIMAVYYDTELFDYYDPIYDADAGDVIAAILSYFPRLKIHITTRGWYLGDEIGPRAAKKIFWLREQYKGAISLRYSLDLNNINRDIARYILRAVEFLDNFAGLNQGQDILLTGGALPEEKDLSYMVLELVMFLTSFTRFSLEYDSIGNISSEGRASKLMSGSSSEDVGDCLDGIHLFADGRFLRKDRQGPREYLFEDTGISLWSSDELIDAITPVRNREPALMAPDYSGIGEVYTREADGIIGAAHGEAGINRDQRQEEALSEREGLGGVDFRFLPIVTQAVGNLKAIYACLGGCPQRLLGLNLKAELRAFENMLKAGITPSTQRIGEYVQASCFRGDIDKNKIIICISDILRQEEEGCLPTDPALRDILVVLESSRTLAELKAAFSG